MQLRDYQLKLAKKGYTILKKFHIVYFILEMRVGKTLVSFKTCELMRFKHVLFITNKIAIGDINNDYKGYAPKFHLDIINYESVHKITDNSHYDCIICDEAQQLGAFPKPSKKAIEVSEIIDDKYLILLSGTPTPESYSQIFHQFQISNWSPFNRYQNFYEWAKSGFVEITKKYITGFHLNDYSKANVKLIEKYVDKYLVSFTQKQAKFKVYSLSDEIITIKMDSKIQDLVDMLIEDRLYEFQDGTQLVCDTAAKLQNKIHQIYSGTVIAEQFNEENPEQPGRITKYLDKSKVKYIVKNYKGLKKVIFYLFNGEGDMLKQAFPKWTNDPLLFNKSKDLTFISQFQSGSKGINLSSADVIIFYNIHFSSELYQQARQRAQTRDKTTKTKLHWLFSANGIEKLIYKRVIKKQDYTSYYFKRDFLGD